MLFNLCSFLKQKQQARGWSMVERLSVISNVIAEVRSQKSEVRSQKSEVRSQKSKVRSQKSEVKLLRLLRFETFVMSAPALATARI
ncbi:MAG: hypothetical protein F6J94_23770 [Moorea sp. SIO1F2]|uniref:hypothetical protein n=1 Tax=unclassified Moorena TaxID=2683338 RepID=UPI0013B8E4D4|nr:MULTISPECIES: hypothetical protein [unclassified Moorena]NEO21507.1 hypothetical protein [Moorena sp. SIO4A5]NEP25416.1 hypothetical protein [Moorena sp. SIO3I6]NEQ59115.1 hypothetical protein [Moorena sp. SIO4A1]NET84823.1 hypothetical protein [Moorena sp. SIO1F2]